MPSAPPESEALRCWAEINLDALRNNASVCRQVAGDGCAVMAIVKADAYGHGLERVVGALVNLVDWFGVANLSEAKKATAASGGTAKVLILSPCLAAERTEAISKGFSVSVSSLQELDNYAAVAAKMGKTAHVHLKADTGMGRMGCAVSKWQTLVESATNSPHIELEGLCTHFPSADDDADFTKQQIAQFHEMIAGSEACLIHLANSAGLLGFSQEIDFANLVRPGIAMYGISPIAELGEGLIPALTLKTKITLMREVDAGTSISYGRTFFTEKPTRVATLAVGYGDGYPRSLSGADTDVLIRGTRCPVLGRVTMDQVVVDISHLDDSIQIDEPVVLIGKQGKEEISTVELAEKAGTIPWEILTGITSRVERISVS